MKRYLVLIIAILSVTFVSPFNSDAAAQVLTINDGSTLTINGSTLDVNCLEIRVKSGGALVLQSGILQDKKVLTVEQGGVFQNISGTVITCGGNAVPVVTPGQSFSIAENSANGTSVGTVVATDDDPGTLFSNWTITGGNIGNVFTINSNTGEITVADNTNLNYDITQTYTLSVTVSDGTDTSGAADVIINVTSVNGPPVLDPVGNKTVNELALLTFTATATDTDVPADTIRFSLTGAPSGAAIAPATGVFTWTPTEAQGPGTYTFDIVAVDDGIPSRKDSETIQVTVNEMNSAPVLVNPGNQINGESDNVSLFIAVTDADVPANTLTWSAGGLPPGLTINPVSGEIGGTITPAATAGSPYAVIVSVQDNGTPAYNDSINFTWTVTDTNRSPVLDPVGNQVVEELSSLIFTATATDPDVPPNVLTFSLAGGPAGASIDPTTGMFTWTPTESQGPGTYTFDLVVTDNGSPSLKDLELISVTVNEVNEAPLLSSVSNKTVEAQSLLTFTASATDNDLPANTLTYSITGLPAGASINPDTGIFAWIPAIADVGSYNVILKVSDTTVEVARSFIITVTEINHPPVFSGTPAISGTPKSGYPLILTDQGVADADGDTITLSYQWKADGVDITGATSDSFVVTGTEQGKTLTCTITANDGKGGTATFTTAGIPIYKFPWMIFIRKSPE